jgi:hypothetical protein
MDIAPLPLPSRRLRAGWQRPPRITGKGIVHLLKRLKDFFGHRLVYADPQPLEGVTLPEQAIIALLVTDDEVNEKMVTIASDVKCPPGADTLKFFDTAQRRIPMLATSRKSCPKGGPPRKAFATW